MSISVKADHRELQKKKRWIEVERRIIWVKP
jgi:hypothetical protein